VVQDTQTNRILPIFVQVACCSYCTDLQIRNWRQL